MALFTKQKDEREEDSDFLSLHKTKLTDADKEYLEQDLIDLLLKIYLEPRRVVVVRDVADRVVQAFYPDIDKSSEINHIFHLPGYFHSFF